MWFIMGLRAPSLPFCVVSIFLGDECRICHIEEGLGLVGLVEDPITLVRMFCSQ